MAAVDQNGLALEYAGSFKKDKGVVMAAIRKNGMAPDTPAYSRKIQKWLRQRCEKMRGASLAGPFKGDPKVVMAAVQECGGRLCLPMNLKEIDKS